MPLKFNVEKNIFLTALTSLQSITAKKGTMAVLSNILLTVNDNFIELTGTDLEVGIKKKINGDIFATGAITLPSKKLFEIVRESGGDVIEIEEKDNNWVKIHTGSSSFNLAGISSDEYPDFPDYDEKILISIPSEMLSELINKTIYSVAQERESNFSLTGALFEKEEKEEKYYLKMISSDGHRLTLMEKESPVDLQKLKIEKNTIIPRKGLIEIKRFCEDNEQILIGLNKKQIVLKSENSLIIIRLMNGEFPDYKNILTVIDRDNYIEIKKISFLESLKRTSIFTDDTFNSIQIDINNDVMILSSQNVDFGNATDELSIKYDKERLLLGFNCKYLIETLHVIDGDTVKAIINSDQSPCLLMSDDDIGFISIIMPMKI